MEFKIEKVLANGLGRVGTIKTAHGEIKTPTFVAVGTNGYVRFLSAEDVHQTGAQVMLSNGYHLRRKSPEIAQAGGLAKWRPLAEQPSTYFPGPTSSSPVVTGTPRFDHSPSVVESPDEVSIGLMTNGLRPDGQPAEPWLGPTITDSGGFQVMSLGSGLGKVVAMDRVDEVHNTAHKERLAHVSNKGVSFIDPFDGEPDFIGPEESMQIQCRIGADIHMAFDELTSLADSYEYNIEAMRRTEAWAERSLREHLKLRDSLGYRQNLYAVLQGGRWEDLRRATAKTLGKMQVEGVEFEGFGLGGAFLKEDLGEILRWCDEELPAEKPRHLLGLSHPDDILIGAEMGADTFDCVAPMREARHGKIYTRTGNLNLRKFANSGAVLDPGCDCTTCRAGWTRGGLRALWRSGELEKKQKYYNLASAHNLRFIVRLTEEIRVAMLEDYFEEYKRDFLAKYYSVC